MCSFILLKALQWLGYDDVSMGNAKLIFASYCDITEKKSPTYKTYEVSSPLFFTMLQIYNNHSISSLDNRKILFNVSVHLYSGQYQQLKSSQQGDTRIDRKPMHPATQTVAFL